MSCKQAEEYNEMVHEAFSENQVIYKAAYDPDRPTYRIIMAWNAAYAEWTYVLQQYHRGSTGGSHWREVARGNKNWAAKNARHYKLEPMSEEDTKNETN